MKLTLLKSTLFTFAFLTLSLIPASTQCALRTPTASPMEIASDPMKEISTILEDCLFDRKNKAPFSHFIDRLIQVVNQYKTTLRSMGDSLPDRFIADLQSIRTSKNPIQVGKILARYKSFMPNSLKNKSLPQLLAGLKFRLSISETGSTNNAAGSTNIAAEGDSPNLIIENETFIQQIIGYLKLLFEGSKEYFRS